MPLGYKCNTVSCQCVPAYPLVGCEYVGNCCRNYFITLMATAGMMEKNAVGEWQMPAGAMVGYMLDGLGYVLTDAGKSPLQAGDVILTAAAKGEKQTTMNEAWFANHWLELQQANAPTEYDVTYWRPGERYPRTITVTRSN